MHPHVHSTYLPTGETVSTPESCVLGHIKYFSITCLLYFRNAGAVTGVEVRGAWARLIQSSKASATDNPKRIDSLMFFLWGGGNFKEAYAPYAPLLAMSGNSWKFVRNHA